MEINKSEISGDLGIIRIADEVVSTIAGLAVIEIEGVAAMSGGWSTDLVEKLGKKNFGKGVKVEINQDETTIDVFVVLEYGYSIPEVAKNAQREVKMAVETMTGLQVKAVNIQVVSVALKKGENLELPAEAQV